MTLKNKSSWKGVIIALVSMIVAVIGLSIKYDFYYDLNDDTVIRDIISGIYTGAPSGYNIQMLYPFSVVIGLFYRAISGGAWYGLFLYGLEFWCIALILNRFLKLQINKNKAFKILDYLLLCLFVFGITLRYLVFLQYSFTCGLLMITATFLFMTNNDEKNKPDTIAAILVILAFAVRTEMCMMLFPFLGIAALVKWSQEANIFSRDNIKKYIGTLAVALCGMALLWGINEIAYRVNPEWQEYREFFDARTRVYDFYGIPQYEENAEFYNSIGLSNVDVELLNNYNFALDEKITTDTLNKIADYQVQIRGTKNTLKEAVWVYKEQIIKLKNGVYSEIILIVYFIYCFFILRTGKFKQLIRLLLLGAARSVIWLYLLKVDRAIDRVTFSLILIELTILITWLLTELNKQSKVMKYKLGRYLIYVLVIISIWIQNLQATNYEYNKREEIAPVYQTLLDYAKNNPQNFYILDVFSTTSYKGVVISEKIFKNVDNSYRNFDLCGGWLAKAPFAKSNNVEEKLLKGEALFISYADKDMLWLTSFYAEKNKAVDIETIDYIKVNDEIIYEVYYVNCLE